MSAIIEQQELKRTKDFVDIAMREWIARYIP